MTATLDRRAPASPAPPPRAAAPRPVPLIDKRGGVANVTLVALSLTTTYALSRLFDRPLHYFAPVACVVIVVHAVAWSCRRSGMPLLPAAGCCLVAGGVVTSWVALGHTTAYGIPWRGTYHAFGPALQAAADAYRATSPPTQVIPGFVIAGAFGSGCAAFLSDWAAFRMRATVEAALPPLSLFILSAALAQGHFAVRASALWFAALLAFLLVRQSAIDGPATAWFASRSGRASGTIIGAGVVIGAVSLLGMSTIGPLLPGASGKAVINWRRTSNGTAGRSTGSPLVDIKSRLSSESDQEVFTVRATDPTYWRITALDTFDGTGWSLDDTYHRVGSTLPTSQAGGLPPDSGPTRSDVQTVQVSSLDSLWLPAAYRPARITGVHRVSYSADASSLITNKATTDGLSYTVVSNVPAVTPAELEESPPVSVTDPTLARYLELPSDLDPEVRQIAESVTAGSRTPYDAALKLQNYLRSPPFRYSLSVPPDDSPHALVDFLTETRAGFCQQFAASYAVLAREIGLPSRVAVGFTEGDLESDGLYHVREDDAHAWPEVYFQGIGWIAFEPTPGRGSPDPSEEALTGVPSGQQAPPASPTVTTPATPTTASGGSNTVAPRGHGGAAASTSSAAHHSHGLGLRWLLVALLLILAGAVLWAGVVIGGRALLAARRRARARCPASRITLAWVESGEALAGAGVVRHDWETPAEYARRARESRLGGPAGQALGRLASTVGVAAYAADTPTPDDAEAAEQDRDVVTSTVLAERSWRDRFRPGPFTRLVASEWAVARRRSSPRS